MSRNRKTTSLQQLFPEDYTYEAQDKPLDDNEEYLPTMTISKVEVTDEFIECYRAISGKGSTKKKDSYCEQHGVDAWKVSQGNYIVK